MNDIASPALLTLEQDIPLTRTCSKCKQELPLTAEYFCQDRRLMYGFCAYCKKCRRQYRQQYNEIHKNEIAQQCKQYYESHKGEVKQKVNQYRKSHLGEIKEHKKQYYSTERGKRVSHLATSRRRAYKSLVPGTLTHEQIQQKLKTQKYRCYYASCNHSKFEKKNGKYIYHLEHTIPLSRTEHNPRHDVNYVVLACPHCNLSKKDKLPHEFFEGGRLF